ncbi:MAG: DUF971 domain-containing protein [Proteobacteria bacterium]|nr:DUF971 domain-containing protein [Pseudomonadota bacterium]
MSQAQAGPVPVDIKLRQKARLLEISFDDGETYKLPCEYLRVFSPSAEVKAAVERGELVHGKSGINISSIQPVGNYAVQLVFDDGHDTGVYSWKTLHELGEKHEVQWADYLEQLKSAGLSRGEMKLVPRKLTLLYFVSLPVAVGKEQEQLEVPASVATVEELIAWLKKRSDTWEQALDRYELTITVNKQFAEWDTPLEEGDEVAIVPQG